MHTNKTEIIDRNRLISLINSQSVKHTWLASKINVSEKTLTRWVNGDVTRIRTGNLKKLAAALNCETEVLIARSEVDVYSSAKNRDILVNELHNDSLLYQLLMSSKIKLAISLIKSTFHPKLPSAILASFYTKLGYASLIHRKLKAAKKHFSKASTKAQTSGNQEVIFSVNLAFAITHFLDFDFKRCLDFLMLCDANKQYAGQEKAHYYNTYSLYYLYTGQFDFAISSSDDCISECAPNRKSVEKELFLSTALQLKGASYLFKGDIEQARTCCLNSLTVANRSGYKRCVDVAKAYLATVDAYQGEFDSALALSFESIQNVNEKDISLPSILCAAIYVHRASGNEQKSRELCEQLKRICNKRSAPIAFSEYQLSLIERAHGNKVEADKIRQQVIELLYELGLEHWVKLLPVEEVSNTTTQSLLEA